MTSFDARNLGGLVGGALASVAYRHQARGFDPRSGEGARRMGGRFNPPHSFPVLSLCLSRPCVIPELSRLADRQGLAVENLLPRELWEFQVELDNVLDLTDTKIVDALNLAIGDLVRDDHRLTREIGEAAHELGFEAIRSPSATGIDHVLAVLPENLAGTVLDVGLVEVWQTADDVTA